MSDRITVDQLLKLAPDAICEFNEDICVSVKLTNKNNIYFGVIRHHSEQEKIEILELLSRLENIQHLDLRKNRLNSIQHLYLENLEYLDLASNYLHEIPNWIGQNKLKFLNIGVNELSHLPDSFSNLTHLEILKIHKNKIRDITVLQDCRQIKFLNLYFNYMKNIPALVWNFTQMEFFSWGISGITYISDEIANWEKLQWLSLVSNKIKKLPNAICGLVELKGLRIHKNELTELPNNIGNLYNLEQLTLYKNRLTTLPDSFYKLKLKKLNVFGNPLTCDVKADWLCSATADCKWEEI